MERSRSCSGNVPSNGSVKIGGLWKRSQGLSRFTRPNYRHRVFILTEQALSYYSGTVDVSKLLDLLHETSVWSTIMPQFKPRACNKLNSCSISVINVLLVQVLWFCVCACMCTAACRPAERASSSGHHYCCRVCGGICLQPATHLPG